MEPPLICRISKKDLTEKEALETFGVLQPSGEDMADMIRAVASLRVASTPIAPNPIYTSSNAMVDSMKASFPEMFTAKHVQPPSYTTSAAVELQPWPHLLQMYHKDPNHFLYDMHAIVLNGARQIMKQKKKEYEEKIAEVGDKLTDLEAEKKGVTMEAADAMMKYTQYTERLKLVQDDLANNKIAHRQLETAANEDTPFVSLRYGAMPAVWTKGMGERRYLSDVRSNYTFFGLGLAIYARMTDYTPLPCHHEPL